MTITALITAHEQAQSDLTAFENNLNELRERVPVLEQQHNNAKQVLAAKTDAARRALTDEDAETTKSDCDNANRAVEKAIQLLDNTKVAIANAEKERHQMQQNVVTAYQAIWKAKAEELKTIVTSHVRDINRLHAALLLTGEYVGTPVDMLGKNVLSYNPLPQEETESLQAELAAEIGL